MQYQKVLGFLALKSFQLVKLDFFWIVIEILPKSLKYRMRFKKKVTIRFQ